MRHWTFWLSGRPRNLLALNTLGQPCRNKTLVFPYAENWRRVINPQAACHKVSIDGSTLVGALGLRPQSRLQRRGLSSNESIPLVHISNVVGYSATSM